MRLHGHINMCRFEIGNLHMKHSAAKYVNLFVYLVKKKKKGHTLSSTHDRKMNPNTQCYHDQMSKEGRNQSWFR